MFYYLLFVPLQSVMENCKTSIVIVAHDQAAQLEQNLPLFLQLEQGEEIEVVVVDDASTDNTTDVLKALKEQYKQLYTTFMPSSVRNPSRLQLAFSIGVKATHGQRIVFADIDRPPVNSAWLSNMEDDEHEVVLLYNRDTTKNEPVRYQYYQRLEDAFRLIVKAERRQGEGHQGNCMKLWRGHYDALIVKRERMFDTIKYFDLSVTGMKLLQHRLVTLWLNPYQ